MSTAETIEIRPFFDGAATANVILDGHSIGEVMDEYMVISGHFYRFADQDAAVAAVISHHRNGYWTGEIG